jgi:hypothetical protein
MSLNLNKLALLIGRLVLVGICLYLAALILSVGLAVIMPLTVLALWFGGLALVMLCLGFLARKLWESCKA